MSVTCPRCRTPLVAAAVDKTPLSECGECHGVWLEIEVFEKLCADRDRQNAILLRERFAAKPNPSPDPPHLPCARCGRTMHRFHYGGISGVYLDICRDHGLWFDARELRRVVEFVQSGGLAQWRSQRDARPFQADKPPPRWPNAIAMAIDLLDVFF